MLIKGKRGQWVPFEVDRSQKHNCMHNTVSTCKPSRVCKPPIEKGQLGNPPEENLTPFWICIIGFILFLAVNLVWLQVIWAVPLGSSLGSEH